MKQRGYPYPGWTLYHATANPNEILEHGFKTRAQLAMGDRERHVVGGGTAHAVSMTIDWRVGAAILVGLKVISRLVKGEMLLGELLIAGAEQAPTGTANVIRNYRLTPERVMRYDEGLRPWHTSGIGVDLTVAEAEEAGCEVLSAFERYEDRSYGADVKDVPEGAVHVKAYFGAYRDDLGKNPELHAIALSGWAPKMAVAEAKSYGTPEAAANNADLVEMYKTMLALSAGPMEPAEVYDPLFFLTNLDAMRELNEDDLEILAADCFADWICIDPVSARRLMPAEADRYRVSPDWYHSCESRLDDMARGREYVHSAHGHRNWEDPSQDWEQPDPRDTVLYMGRAMAEVRVFDPSLLDRIRPFKSLADVEEELDPDYNQPGHLIVAYPWFRQKGN